MYKFTQVSIAGFIFLLLFSIAPAIKAQDKPDTELVERYTEYFDKAEENLYTGNYKRARRYFRKVSREYNRLS